MWPHENFGCISPVFAHTQTHIKSRGHLNGIKQLYASMILLLKFGGRDFRLQYYLIRRLCVLFRFASPYIRDTIVADHSSYSMSLPKQFYTPISYLPIIFSRAVHIECSPINCHCAKWSIKCIIYMTNSDFVRLIVNCMYEYDLRHSAMIKWDESNLCRRKYTKWQ